MSRLIKTPPLTQSEKNYILKVRSFTTVPDIARKLGRGDGTIYGYFKDKGWTPFKKPQQPRHSSHPFRLKNNQLEAVIIQRRIENRAHNPKGLPKTAK